MVTLPFGLIIEMGKIRLCKADRNYSLPPPLLRQKPTQGHWSFKKKFSSLATHTCCDNKKVQATQYNQICEESNLQFNGESYITSLFFHGNRSQLKLLVNS